MSEQHRADTLAGTAERVRRGLRAAREFVNELPLNDGVSKRAIDREFIAIKLVPDALLATDELVALAREGAIEQDEFERGDPRDRVANQRERQANSGGRELARDPQDPTVVGASVDLWHCTMADRVASLAEWEKLWQRAVRAEARVTQLAEALREIADTFEIDWHEAQCIARAALDAGEPT